jgi:tetratricopeptide (TPR) repeat protein
MRQVQPLLKANDALSLVALLKANWTCDQVTALLTSEHCDARKVAALALSLVGTRCCIDGLARQLSDPDPMVNQMAEHALWSVWSQLGSPEANHQVARGSAALGRLQYQHAIEHFDRAIALDPTFAEAYNQRALANYLLEEFPSSIRDCQKTVELMPCHFGAWAGMGHCHAHLGDLQASLKAYRRALEINPHLSSILQTIDELERRLDPA